MIMILTNIMIMTIFPTDEKKFKKIGAIGATEDGSAEGGIFLPEMHLPLVSAIGWSSAEGMPEVQVEELAMSAAGVSIARRKWRGGYFYMLRVGSTDIYKVGMTVKNPSLQARRYNAGLDVCGVRKRHHRDKLLEVVESLFVRDVERCRWLETMMKREIYHLQFEPAPTQRRAYGEWFVATSREMKRVKNRLRLYIDRVYTRETGEEIEQAIKRRISEAKWRKKQVYVYGRG